MLTKQRDTLQDRLAKRKNLRNKRLGEKNSVDESEITLVNTSPTTRSLDRSTNKTSTTARTNISSSSILTKKIELPPIEKSKSEQNYFFPNEKTNSSPVLEQITKSSSVNAEDEKQASTKSLSSNDKPTILKELVTFDIPNQHDEPIVTKETVVPTSPTVLPQKSQSNIRQTNCYSTPHCFANQSPDFDFQQSTSTPESAAHTQAKHFHYPIFHPKPLQRAISEQAVSSHQSKLIPFNSIFVKQNALALPYLFNRRLIEAEFSRGTSLDSTDIQQKTVWD